MYVSLKPEDGTQLRKYIVDILYSFWLLLINSIVFLWSFFITGSIPLRQLVYRVHPLPESMRPLVWDFGQLTHHTEELYTKQIVRRFVITVTPGVSIPRQRVVRKTCFTLTFIQSVLEEIYGTNYCIR